MSDLRVTQCERCAELVTTLDLPLPLIGGFMATLRVPRPMSSENYDLLRSMLDTNLTLLRPAIVRDPPAPPAPEATE